MICGRVEYPGQPSFALPGPLSRPTDRPIGRQTSRQISKRRMRYSVFFDSELTNNQPTNQFFLLIRLSLSLSAQKTVAHCFSVDCPISEPIRASQRKCKRTLSVSASPSFNSVIYFSWSEIYNARIKAACSSWSTMYSSSRLIRTPLLNSRELRAPSQHPVNFDYFFRFA